ncbi:response regulator transcription factor NblR [Gloeocapsa sp. PCC 73106]|uniref:response regulator transcription factor NblR n=1 Tax=Gloeocapsa sp. PCC 73106 TaxID=102232 RepID=UPI0002ACA287|nr:response regulator transcription factor [Gloeocapsa sp. PCC 73106]ELR97227.1 response regulator with CheY-like receiver domain and winged-helix DNA-binding domain [Gloeocapsa sp. PCC 73106]
MSYPLSNASQNVLLVRTDELFTQLASHTLKEIGCNPVSLYHLEQVFTQVQLLQPVMLIFDHALTGKEGSTLVQQLRNKGYYFPILMLIDQETLAARIACLESGADDYLVKPVYPPNFLQVLRIYLDPPEISDEQLHFGELSLDLSSRKLVRHGETVDLTMKEFELLKYLMSHPKEILTRDQILENVWGYDFRGESNVIEVYIRYLRLKIEKQGQKRIIHTIRGVGYVLKE